MSHYPHNQDEVNTGQDANVKGTYYSDDGINIALNTQEIKMILQVYEDFSDCSELEVNLTKTNIIHNHNIKNTTLEELAQMGICRKNISENYVFLGYEICCNRQSPTFLSTDLLIRKLIQKVSSATARWDLKR